MKKNIFICTILCAFSLSAYAGGNNNQNNGGGNNQDQSQGQHQGQNQSQGQAQGQLQGQAQFSNNEASARSSSHSTSVSLAGAAAGAISNSGGNTQGTSVSINHEAARPAASAPAISLTSVGTDNCLGSVSGSFGTGFFSIGGGSTTESVECNRRAYSRALRDLGQTGAAVALLCLNEEVASVTPACKAAAKVSSAAEAMPVNMTGPKVSRAPKDEFICARTGEQC